MSSPQPRHHWVDQGQPGATPITAAWLNENEADIAAALAARAELLGGAPEEYNTLGELAAAVVLLSQTKADAAPTVVRPRPGPRGMWPWYAALAGRQSAPADVMVIGDSISEGSSVAALGDRWIERMRDHARRRFPTAGVAGGQGYVSAYYVSPTLVHGWTYGGDLGVDSRGPGARGVRLGAASGYIERQVTGTGVRVYYAKASGGGSFRVLVDGTAKTTVATDGAADAGAWVDVALGAAGAHTLRIESTTSANAYVGGVAIRNGDEAAGLRVFDSSHHGIQAANYGADSPAAGLVRQWVRGVKPALVVLELGANDRYNNVAPADFRADVDYLIAEVRAAMAGAPVSILLLGVYELFASQAYPWSAYRAQLAAAAAANPADVAFADLSSRWPAGDGVDALDLLDPDNAHPNVKGSELLAIYLTELISPY